eukprot:TRINITY_DN1064_c0_g1_i5.p1 TRINITY_DN1064_c0_g1~~TRINITY_DN1064_c0_g1_i5.p1  ORF type:complete len:256 (-),score=65.42 TRINITY_DN1064_c0_g1_i5:68-835(-)
MFYFFILCFFFFFFSSRRRHTRCREVSWARRCVQETGINAEYMGDHFAQKMKENGISRNRPIICYSNKLPHGGIRAWYLLQAFGHPEAYLMNGNLDHWTSQGFPLSKDNNPRSRLSAEGGDYAYTDTHMESNVNIDEVIECVKRGDTQFLDARGESAFNGKPTKSHKINHIPGAINVEPFNFFDENSQLKPKENILDFLKTKKVDLSKKTIVYCMRGVVATTMWTALAYAGFQTRIYHGSWIEYGIDPRTPALEI